MRENLIFRNDSTSELQSVEITKEYVDMINKVKSKTGLGLDQLDNHSEDDYIDFLEVSVQPDAEEPFLTVFQEEKETPEPQTVSKPVKVIPKQSQSYSQADPPSNASLLETQMNHTPLTLINSSKRKANDDNLQINAKRSKSNLESFFHDMAEITKKFPAEVQSSVQKDICETLEGIEKKYSEKVLQKDINLTNLSMLPKMILIPCSMIDKKTAKNSF